MNRFEFQKIAYKGAANRGNRHRIKRCMKKALEGQPITVGFFGGSITQGSLASSPKLCYAHLVYEWWKQKFPQAEVTYVNAGIGGTSSQFGVARAKSDLLVKKPDFVIIEFSVNDDPTDFFEETYEGLVRTVVRSTCQPAVLLLHNVRYDTGVSAEDRHLKIGKAYDLPCVSMKPCLYQNVKSGCVRVQEISPDGLHPNDLGHRLVADTVISCLEEIFKDIKNEEIEDAALPSPLTLNRYENSKRLRNINCEPECIGFVKDIRAQNGVSDFFKNGWSASKVGSALIFVFKGTSVAVQYRRSAIHPAPIAIATLDGDNTHSVKLDANFDETWGDCLCITTVAQDISGGSHHLEVRITEAAADLAADFYFASVIITQ